jgi:hypothetical protein
VWGDGDPVTCEARVAYGNDGPAQDAQVRVTGDLTLPGTCAAEPTGAQSFDDVLDSGDRTAHTFVWEVTCDDADVVHTFGFSAAIAQTEPHLTDDPGNNGIDAVWSPMDHKPNSDPNSIRLDRGGLTSVAILATAGFDPFRDLDPDSLAFGPTGAETPAVRCAREPEDVNGDGLGDLTCKFSVAQAGLEPSTTLVLVRGSLLDGTPFVSADTVRVI